MHNEVKLTEKYERNGWPSVQRPDIKPPDGWSLELVSSLNLIHHHQLSPDGKHIAFMREIDGRSDIFTLPISGGWPQPLTSNRSKTIYWLDGPPQWSADGQWLAFSMNGHVHVVSAEGRDLSKSITDFTGGAWSPVWMPDNHRLIVTAERHEADILLLTDREGGWPRLLTPGFDGDARDATPSPDGRFVAYVHYPFDDLNRLELRLVELETGQVRHLTNTPKEKDWSPLWSPSGEQIAFLSQRSGYTQIWLDPAGW